MGVRTRKAIGGLAILAFLLLYVGAAAKLGSMLPDQWAVRLLYYVVAGTAWGVPLIPLLGWMNRD
ncbi:MAG: DUF2842 domain-containing protein [Caulobacteraceae bacterium]|nr:DUF2842 domain-containing protein [Caulobacteraceae bacterium]